MALSLREDSREETFCRADTDLGGKCARMHLMLPLTKGHLADIIRGHLWQKASLLEVNTIVKFILHNSGAVQLCSCVHFQPY